MRIRLFAGLLLVLLTGCGGPGALAPPSTGTVTGLVTSRVCGGAYRAQADETPCTARAMSGVRLTFRLQGSSSTHMATSDASGAYRVDLRPGTYAIEVNGPGSPSRLSGPRQLTVTAGQTVTADFTFTVQLL